jgi:hypothetical protein
VTNSSAVRHPMIYPAGWNQALQGTDFVIMVVNYNARI